MGCGLSNKEIANTLSASEHTVKNHIQRMRKLGATDRLSPWSCVELMAWLYSRWAEQVSRARIVRTCSSCIGKANTGGLPLAHRRNSDDVCATIIK